MRSTGHLLQVGPTNMHTQYMEASARRLNDPIAIGKYDIAGKVRMQHLLQAGTKYQEAR